MNRLLLTILLALMVMPSLATAKGITLPAPDGSTQQPDSLSSVPDSLSSVPDSISSAPDSLSSAPDSLRAQAEAERLADSLLTVARINMLPEVMVYGQYHYLKEKMHLTMSKTKLQLLQPKPQGFSPLGLIVWAVDKLWGNKHRHRKEMQRQKHKMILDNY